MTVRQGITLERRPEEKADRPSVMRYINMCRIHPMLYLCFRTAGQIRFAALHVPERKRWHTDMVDIYRQGISYYTVAVLVELIWLCREYCKSTEARTLPTWVDTLYHVTHVSDTTHAAHAGRLSKGWARASIACLSKLVTKALSSWHY